jgi:hypothetical protein
MMTRSAIKGGGLLLLAALLAWRVLVNGLAEHYAGQETPEAASAALRWRGDQPAALYQRGLASSEREPAAAGRWFQAAIWADPTDALAYLALAELWAGSGRQPAAIELVEIADVLAPLRSPALARSATFWLSQNRPDRALERWSLLLRTRPETAGQLYPLLLRLADNPAAQPLLRPLLDKPPEWWDGFFAYAAVKAERPDTVVFLYQHRNRAGRPPDIAEQRVYLDRLWKEGRWLEAYLAWLSGLDERRQQGLGHLYNGGFELPVTGIGFDWRISSPRGALVEIAETYGTGGGKALHVAFDGQRVRFQHVQQPLYLEPGSYRLQGRARPDGLRAERGLRWAVRCGGSEVRLLAETDSFAGKDDWQVFTTRFTVPDAGCPVQMLRLELRGQAELDFEAQGGIWFDDLTIVQQG